MTSLATPDLDTQEALRTRLSDDLHDFTVSVTAVLWDAQCFDVGDRRKTQREHIKQRRRGGAA